MRGLTAPAGLLAVLITVLTLAARPGPRAVAAPAGPVTTPNDPLFYRQWDLQLIQAPFAWETARGAGTTIVAVIDSGVDLHHPDLAPHLQPIGCDVIADHTCPAD